MKLLLIILLLSASCQQTGSKKQVFTAQNGRKVIEWQKQEQVVVYRKDTTLFTHIKYDFFKDSTGSLFWKYVDDGAWDTVSINFAEYFCKHSSKERIYFKTFIDIDSYKELDSCLYSVDKNHVFYFQPCSCGGHFYIVEGADPKTFRRLGSYDTGVDKNFYYFKAERTERRINSI